MDLDGTLVLDPEEVLIFSLADIDGSMSGKLTGDPEPITADIEVLSFPNTYDGDYIFVSATDEDQVIDTDYRVLEEDIIIRKIPYYETSNETGTTVYIGG